MNGRTLTLTGQAANGLVFHRTISLPERGTRITIRSSIENGAKEPRTYQLRCRAP